MKKLLSFLTSLGFFVGLFAQTSPVFQYSDYAPADKNPPITYSQKNLSTPFIISEAPNEVWDFSAFTAGPASFFGFDPNTDNFFPSANIKSPFLGDNVGQLFLDYDNYLVFDSLGLKSIGRQYYEVRQPLASFTGNNADSIIIPQQSMPIPDIYEFPLSMTFQDTWSADHVRTLNGQLTITAFGLNKAAFVKKTYVTQQNQVTGWGETLLKTPSGSISLGIETLLVKSTGISIDSFFVNGQPAPTPLLTAFSITQGEKTQIASHIGWQKGKLFPIFITHYDDTTFLTAASSVYNYNQLFALGVNAPTHPNSLSVYPNPSQDGLFYIDITAPQSSLYVYDAAGKVIMYQTNIPQGVYPFALSKIASKGLYRLNIVNDKGIQSATLVCE